jgi:hypothetical protein
MVTVSNFIAKQQSRLCEIVYKCINFSAGCLSYKIANVIGNDCIKIVG